MTNGEVEIDEVIGLLDAAASDVAALRSACEARVVRWLLATTAASLDRPEPLYAERSPARWAGRIIGPCEEPPARQETWSAVGAPLTGTLYGLDTRDRFVVGRSLWPDNVGERLLWTESGRDASTGRLKQSQFIAELTNEARLRSIAVVHEQDGHAVRGIRVDALTLAEDRYSWRAGRPVGIWSLVLSRSSQDDGELCGWRASYDAMGALTYLHAARATLEDLAVSLKDAEVATFSSTTRWSAIEVWTTSPSTTWEVVWDWRLDRTEEELPAAETFLGGLAEELAEILRQAAEDSVRSGMVRRPFVIMPSSAGPEWLSWIIADEELRVRAARATVGGSILAALPHEGTRLELLDQVPPSILQRVRQLRQLADERVAAAFEAQLVQAANRVAPTGATSDFLVAGRDWAVTAAVLGPARVGSFRAACELPPPPRITIGKLEGPESIRRVAEHLGLAAVAGRIAANARWGFELVHAGSSAPTNSRLGGRPPLRSPDDWPEFRGRPLSFLALIDLAEVALASAGLQIGFELPQRGMLLFFADLLDWQGDPATGPNSAARVLLVTSAHARRARRRNGPAAGPSDGAPSLRALPLALRARLTIPPVLEGLDFWESLAYQALVERISRAQGPRVRAQLFGHPTDIAQVDEPLNPQHHLLLQLSHDARTGFAFGDGGDILFTATRETIKAGRWSEVIATGASG